MENYTSTPTRRVFQIDRECYVVYLGTDSRDLRPFLRIGTGRGIPETARPEIGTVVVTPSLTGNPLHERNSVVPAGSGAIRYLGDPQVTERYRSFLRRLALSPVQVENFGEVLSGIERSLVFFFEDGNITLLCNGVTLFDLARREKRDLHFRELAAVLAKRFAVYPCRYVPSLFTGMGLFRIGGSLFVTASGTCTAFGLPTDYFLALSRFGIDPDSIETVVSRTLPDETVNLFKRVRETKRPLAVVTDELDRLGPLTELFELSEVGCKAYPAEGEWKSLSGIRFRHRGEVLELSGPETAGLSIAVTESEQPDSAAFGPSPGTKPGAASPVPVISSPAGLSVPVRDRSVVIPDGVPVMFETDLPEREECVMRFISRFLESFRSLLGPQEHARFDRLVGSVSETAAGSPFPRIPASELVSPFAPYFLHNCVTAAALFSRETGRGTASGPTAAELSEYARTLPRPSVHLPLVCRYYRAAGVAFYEYPHRVFPDAAYRRYLEEAVSVERKLREREELFLSERERLARLVEELKTVRAVPVPPVRTGVSAPAAAVTGTPVSDKNKPADRSTVGGEVSPVRAAGRQPLRLRTVLIPAAVLLSLAGGVALWRTASWNRERGSSDGSPEGAFGSGTPSVPAAGITRTDGSGSTADILPETSGSRVSESRLESESGEPASAEGQGARHGPSFDPLVLPPESSRPMEAAREELDARASDASEPGHTTDRIADSGPHDTGPAASVRTDEPTPAAGTSERPLSARDTVDTASAVGTDQGPTDSTGSAESPTVVETRVLGQDVVQVTADDIAALMDTIARLNGLPRSAPRTADDRSVDRVSPGTGVKLPDGRTYTATDRTDLRNIALELIRENLDLTHAELRQLESRFNTAESSADRERALLELERLRQRSYCEHFIRLVNTSIQLYRTGR